MKFQSVLHNVLLDNYFELGFGKRKKLFENVNHHTVIFQCNNRFFLILGFS